MKKYKISLILVLFLSTLTLAEDGDLPTGGGKTCPPGQTICREAEPTDGGFIKFFSDLLSDIFG